MDGLEHHKMYLIGKYKESDRMSDLICENYSMLLVMSRFGISLGFGDETIGKVCGNNNVDVATFLAVVNLLISDDNNESVNYADLSARELMIYLRNSHSYYLDFRLPAIRTNLIAALDSAEKEMSLLIIRYFDEYVAEVRKHLAYEEDTVFPYVEALLANNRPKNYSIDIFSRKHDNIESRLSELKNIIIKYYPVRSSNELNSVLFDIFSCAKDLLSHTDVEDSLFVPLIRDLELNSCR